MRVLLLLFFSLIIFIIFTYEPEKKLIVSGFQYKTHAIIDEINKNNQKISSFSCNVKTKHLHGFLAYEKPRNFYLTLGNELIIGSNSTHFWFWSKRMKNPGLYWSTHENFYKTRLKTPFNPLWLSKCLGVDEINYQDALIDNNRILKKDYNASLEPIVNVIYFPEKIIEIYKYGKLIARSERKTNEIKFNWCEENISMIWYLDNIQINKKYNLWKMPNNITPKIEMLD